MQKKRVVINAIMSITQIVSITAILFILYRFLLNTLGIEKLGIWSLVLASTSVTQIASFGLSGSVVKFVAKYIARGEDKKVSGVIQTAAISAGVLMGIVLLALYPLIKWLLGLVITDNSISLAVSILPHALVSLWFMVVTGIFQAGLDGYQRIDLRSLLLISGAFLHLLLCYLLASRYGLIGVAWARIIQNCTIFLCSWICLRKYLPLLPVFPYRFNKRIFREIIVYGVNFQVVSIATMLCDPVTKALLSKFGGLSMVGYYELANKMVQQIRSVIISANQVLVPAIADLKEKDPSRIKSIYLISYELIFFLSLPIYSTIVIFIPTVSILWIGHYENIFVIFSLLLSAGWFFNTLAGPAYFMNLGTGYLRWNVTAHIIIAFLNTCLGYIAGTLLGGKGVVYVWVFSLAFGSSLIYLSYHKKYQIPLAKLLPRSNRIMIAVSAAAVVLTLIINLYLGYLPDSMLQILLLPLFLSAVIFASFWFHPMRKRLQGLITSELNIGK